MLIREMTLEDIERAVELEMQCFSTPWSPKSFQDSITRDDTLFLVCETKKLDLEKESTVSVGTDDSIKRKNTARVIGYIGMYISCDEGSITNVAISPDYRKKGYGEALVDAIKEKARAKQVEKIFLEVRVSNIPAIMLYTKMGFENLGKRKNFYDHPKEDAYIMSCDLQLC